MSIQGVDESDVDGCVVRFYRDGRHVFHSWSAHACSERPPWCDLSAHSRLSAEDTELGGGVADHPKRQLVVELRIHTESRCGVRCGHSICLLCSAVGVEVREANPSVSTDSPERQRTGWGKHLVNQIETRNAQEVRSLPSRQFAVRRYQRCLCRGSCDRVSRQAC